MIERVEVGDRVREAERVVAAALVAFADRRFDETYDFIDRDS